MDVQTKTRENKKADSAKIEAALQSQNIAAKDFERSLQSALAATGGVLLFQMRVDHPDRQDYVAAISIGAGNDRRFFLIILPTDDGRLRVEPVETSDNPLARIAAAYAGLADIYSAAA